MRVKTSVTIEESVLEAIDKAKTPTRTRSRVLEDAAREFLARRARAARDARGRAITGVRRREPTGAHRFAVLHRRIHCDALVSLPKSLLTDHVGALATSGMRALDQALRVALGLC